MTIDIMTLFPEICETVLNLGVIGRGIKKGLVDIKYHQIRDFSDNKYRRIDDAPYGGGGGMIMSAEPIYKCFEHIKSLRNKHPFLVFMSPKGKILTQNLAKSLKKHENIVFLCGRYEGVDERIIEEIVDLQVSIGDYVVSGGELPAMIVIDAILRMLPGMLPSEENFTNESHYNNQLEGPQYTRPRIWHGQKVPEVLTSGDHAKIKKWREHQSLIHTFKYRPDLLDSSRE
ncbi:MAG: tRNA (guanosine(37)-N1)-methyltransferase TrmD [Candidatus Improbicoccus devescovinae]|nr:MAG: tRNA (guanosine(37)-N1)-methyltransferase TrmD [Candidatus Improbicoccus devescovinae]